MANEILLSFAASKTVYIFIWNKIGQIWNNSTSAFETYAAGNIANYAISLTQQGASSFYLGTFPAAIANGDYSIAGKQQIGGAVAETDPTIAVESIYPWNGSAQAQIADLTTSGQLGQLSPIRLARGTQVLNFPIYLKSAADHVTPFTSGVVSGQIARDGGSFGALQSGAFTEVGLGWYNLSALTSGDLLANTVKLNFSANGISGGTADNLPIGIVLQRTSGQ